MNALTIVRDHPNQSSFAEGSVARIEGKRGAGFSRLVLVMTLHVQAARREPRCRTGRA